MGGIQDFSEPLDYVFFVFNLVFFLEDKGAEDQFILSELTEFIVTLFPGVEDIDWTLFGQRRSLVRVLQYVRGGLGGLLRINDGSEQGFHKAQRWKYSMRAQGYPAIFFTFFHR